MRKQNTHAICRFLHQELQIAGILIIFILGLIVFGLLHIKIYAVANALFHSHHPVTDTNMGLDILSIRVFFYFLAQGCHMHPQ